MNMCSDVNSMLGHVLITCWSMCWFMLEHVLVTCWGAAGRRGTRPKKKLDVEEGPPLRGALSIVNLEAI